MRIFIFLHAGGTESEQPSTPYYNTSILQDLVMCKHTAHLAALIEDSQGIKEGLTLLRVWLHQRQLDVVRVFLNKKNKKKKKKAIYSNFNVQF